VPVAAAPQGEGAGEWVLLLILVGASVSVCYLLAKKKRRNPVLAIVLGLFLNVWAAIAYLIIPARPDSSIPARPDSSVSPPEPDFQGYRSVRSGRIGAVVVLLSSLVVLGLASSLTGGEGDLGAGLIMLVVFVSALVAVSYLGVAAIWRGVSSLRQAREVGRPTRARIGIALGALDLCAAVGGVLFAWYVTAAAE
jgi:hypothetical protein